MSVVGMVKLAVAVDVVILHQNVVFMPNSAQNTRNRFLRYYRFASIILCFTLYGRQETCQFRVQCYDSDFQAIYVE